MTTHESTGPPRNKSVLDSILGIFSPVHAGEGRKVLLLALNIFVLMTAYYIIKPVREALILAEWGAEAKIYASAGQAVLLLGAVPLYGRLAARVNRRRLISTVLVFFTVCLVVFYLLAQTRVSLGIPFFLWVGIFNLMVVAQFWSFANDLYTPEQGKRLFAIVGFGMSSGAVVGGLVTDALIDSLGVYQLMLLSGALLMGSLFLTLAVDSKKAEGAENAPRPQEDLSGPNGFTLVARSRYLQLIAAMLVLMNLVNSSGEYVLGAKVKDAKEAEVPEVVRTPGMTDDQFEAAEKAREDEVGKKVGGFYASFFSVVNLVGLLTQLFLVSRLIQFFGVRWGIRILPLIALGGYALIAIFPVLAVTRWAKTAENATDYSLQNTVRNMLWLPTTRQEKYKAKQAIDTFFFRAGDVMAAFVVLLGTTFLNMTPTGFALANVGFAAIWLWVTLDIARRFEEKSA
jgi:AAA family ATP:ADP antiporter